MSNAVVLPELLIVNVKVSTSPASPVIGIAVLSTFRFGSTMVTGSAETGASDPPLCVNAAWFVSVMPRVLLGVLRTTARYVIVIASAVALSVSLFVMVPSPNPTRRPGLLTFGFVGALMHASAKPFVSVVVSVEAAVMV